MSNPDPFSRYGPARITLVGGSGRSGTTLLRRLLGRHADVREVPEWRLPVDPGGLVDVHAALGSAWTPLLFDAHFRRLEKLLKRVGAKPPLLRGYRGILHRFGFARRSMTNLDVSYGAVDAAAFCPRYPELVDELLAALKVLKYHGIWTGTPFLSSGEQVLGAPRPEGELAMLFGGFYRGVVHETLAASGKGHYLEKNTWYPLVFDRFVRMVPEAKLVNIWRDPRDVVCSLTEQRWAPDDLLSAARYYRSIMDRWYDVRARLPASAFLDVNYEDLVTDPAGTLGRVSTFAGLPVSAEPFELSENSVGRWRKQLSARQLEAILPYLAPELDGRNA